jgi:hypothetical protein
LRVSRIVDKVHALASGDAHDCLDDILLRVIDDVVEADLTEEIERCSLARRANYFESMKLGDLSCEVSDAAGSACDVDPLTLVLLDVGGYHERLVRGQVSDPVCARLGCGRSASEQNILPLSNDVLREAAAGSGPTKDLMTWSASLPSPPSFTSSPLKSKPRT